MSETTMAEISEDNESPSSLDLDYDEASKDPEEDAELLKFIKNLEKI